MKRLASIVSGCFIAFAALIYLGDSLVLHLRAQPYDTVTIQHYYAIQQKNGRLELQFDRTDAQSCARSIFPHAGHEPCWYLKRHTEQWTKI